ncbi:MAG: hypothetical protein U0169_26745 [Polyangiaceae bacterium]
MLRGVTYLFGEIDLGDDSPLVGLSPEDLPRRHDTVLVRRTHARRERTGRSHREPLPRR